MEKLPQHILFVLFSYLPKVTDGTYNLIKYPDISGNRITYTSGASIEQE